MEDISDVIIQRLKDMKKPLMFLENKLNEFMAWCKPLVNKIKLDLVEVSAKSDESAFRIKELNGECHQLRLQMKQLKEELLPLADREFVESMIRRADNSNAERFLRVEEDLSEYSEWAKDSERVYVEMSEQVRSLWHLLTEARNLHVETKDNLSSLSEDNRKSSDEILQSQMELSKKSDAFLSGAEVAMDKQSREMENILKSVQQADKRLRSDSAQFSKFLNDEMLNMEKSLLKGIQSEADKRKELDRRLEEFHQILYRIGNPGKDVEDFIKQVSYNARQIANIQKTLEEAK